MKVNGMKFGVMVFAASLAVTTVSCKKKGCTDPTATNYSEEAKKDDGSCEYEEETPTSTQTITKAGAITANETWTANNVYKLVGKVVVEDGVTLTIEPGTIVKGEEGTGTLASALVVAQGGILNAVGTASAPIIFTSVLDNIQPGQLTGTNLDETDQGLWGGIIVLGRAKVSAGDGDVLSQIEGIPTSDAFGAFGGTDDADDSGHLEYISIRHGGALIGAGNEINGLTLGGVGTGTTISNIEVVANLDDGIEFFGGTVNVSNIIVGYQGDDAIDIDMNYAGTIDKFLVINGNNSDESLEIDGPEGVTYTNGMFTLSNGATNGNADFKSKAQGNIINVLLNTIKIRSSFETDCVTEKTDAYTNLINGNLIFSQAEYSSINVYTATSCTVPTSYQTTADNLISNNMVELSPVSVSWTWGYINGKY